MLNVALVLFLFPAMLGVILLFALLKKQQTSKPIALIHGSLGGLGVLLTLTWLALGEVTLLYLTALGLLLIAITLGLILFGYDVGKRDIPKWLALMHPLFAISGIILLICFIVQHSL